MTCSSSWSAHSKRRSSMQRRCWSRFMRINLFSRGSLGDLPVRYEVTVGRNQSADRGLASNSAAAVCRVDEVGRPLKERWLRRFLDGGQTRQGELGVWGLLPNPIA